jgi:hypothetical protein
MAKNEVVKAHTTTHEVPAAPPEQPTLVGKTVKQIDTTHVGSVFVVDILCTDDNHYFIKTKQGALEIGGTAEWDTGDKK